MLEKMIYKNQINKFKIIYDLFNVNEGLKTQLVEIATKCKNEEIIAFIGIVPVLLEIDDNSIIINFIDNNDDQKIISLIIEKPQLMWQKYFYLSIIKNKQKIIKAIILSGILPLNEFFAGFEFGFHDIIIYNDKISHGWNDRKCPDTKGVAIWSESKYCNKAYDNCQYHCDSISRSIHPLLLFKNMLYSYSFIEE